MSVAFAERRIDIDGAAIQCCEAGDGQTVVVLHGDTAHAISPLCEMLAEKFRVVSLAGPALAIEPEGASSLLPRIAGDLGLERYALMACGDAAAAALAHAGEAAQAVEALILVAPTGKIDPLNATLGTVTQPALVLVGAKERQAHSFGRVCADRLPESYLMLVYDAGATMENDRPAALFEAVADFVERRGRFVLERRDSTVSP
jgi:pimeloyl-ACP methyl ester carboxylesterase